MALLGIVAGLPSLVGASPATSARVTTAPVKERIVVVELRPGTSTHLETTRAALASALASHPRIALRTSPALDAALAGHAYDASRARAATALAATRAAYGRLDCRAVDTFTRTAIGAFAGVQASGADVVADLRVAYTYRLLCADNLGTAAGRSNAMTAAANLRALAGTLPPKGIGAAVWSRYPELDAASNVLMARLTIAATPGAAVWVNHKPAGTAPVVLIVPRGDHRVAVADANGHISQIVDVVSDTASVTLTPPPGSTKWRAVRTRVAAWRSAVRAPTRAGLAALMKDTGVRFAIAVTGAQAVVWGADNTDVVARRLGVAPLASPEKLAALVVASANKFDGKHSEPRNALLVDSTSPATARNKPQKWWVYASIIGAVAVGAGIIVSRDLATDRQRIQLKWP